MMNSVLEIKNLTYVLQKNKQKILDNISLSINPGDFIVIIGHNGSGKSTFLKTINRDIDCYSGDILFNGKSITSVPNKICSKKIFKITQNLSENLFEELSVYENFLLYTNRGAGSSGFVDKQECIEVLNSYNISVKLDQKVLNLSGGQKQTLAIALSLLYPPDILLLDEHTSALDPKIAKKIMQITTDAISKHKMTCIMVTHNIDQALEYGSKIYSMQDGVLKYFSDDKKNISKKEILKNCF
ncbi:MAG: putative ABC transport system ATP-binding protein [Candidatus Midichloriaceae bacterium]|jgi:putative ABC transport system ATP-binding protein